MSDAGSAAIRLLLADVDGTLVTPDKKLTERAIRSVGELRDAGVLFAITSGRPPRGMQMLIYFHSRRLVAGRLQRQERLGLRR